MPDLDPAAYDNVFSVLALAIIVTGAVAMKWLSTMKRENTETKDKVERLVTSVTKNNGGSSVKDQLDRIEAKVDGLDHRVLKLESPVEPGTPAKATGTQMARTKKESPH